MVCVGAAGSQIRQHGACDADESQEDNEDSSRHWREQPVQFFAADVPHCDTDSDWQDWRSAYGRQRAQSMRRSLLCAASQLIPQWMMHSLGLLWELSGVVLDVDAACSHFDDGCTMLMHEDACR